MGLSSNESSVVGDLRRCLGERYSRWYVMVLYQDRGAAALPCHWLFRQPRQRHQWETSAIVVPLLYLEKVVETCGLAFLSPCYNGQRWIGESGAG